MPNDNSFERSGLVRFLEVCAAIVVISILWGLVNALSGALIGVLKLAIAVFVIWSLFRFFTGKPIWSKHKTA